MPKVFHPSLLLLVSPLLAACSSVTTGPAASPGSNTTLTSAANPAEETNPDAPLAALNDAPPMRLEDWRKVQKEGESASKTPELTQRIEQCKRFIAANEGHHATGDVLEALTDAMVEEGNYDATELARFVEMRCKTDEDATRLPVELVREYHVKHGLPIDSALRMLDEARTRLDRDWDQDVEAEKDDASKRRAAIWIDYQRMQTYVLEGRIHLDHKSPTAALSALDRAAKAALNVPSGVMLRGETTQTLATGLQDKLHLLRATSLHQLGRTDEAKAAFADTVGFISDVQLRELYDKTKKDLGLDSKSARVVTAQAQMAQDFALQDLSGKTVKLSDYRGKVVIMTFWATWCGPCKKEMPVLQKFLAANKDKGVEVLAINTDSFNSRSKVAPFMKKEGISGFKVVYEDAEQLSSYNYSGIPALYVVDREGRIAHARTGYDSDLENKLANEVAPLISGENKDSQRSLFSIEMAPPGFDVQWKHPVAGDAKAVAIRSGSAGKLGELGIVGREGLMRWTADGESAGSTPLSGYTMGARTADLDGDGKQEWVLAGWQSLKVVDSRGELYWDYKTSRMADVKGIADLDGDGFAEIIVKDEDKVLAMKAIPEARWKTEGIEGLEAVAVSGSDVLVQVDGSVLRYGADGKTRGKGTKAPEGMQAGGTAIVDGKSVELYLGRWDKAPITDFDVDGDGRPDIIITSNGGIVAYNDAGTPILKIRGEGAGLSTAVGDLDGKPGAEVAIFVEHYGLVVLGKKN
ncbi:MAG: redoxin domain-containing protein [Nannocystaceae bacterium]|nr:redoxin domain-containing protein [Nannocystaceae bacterium]